MEGRIRIVSKIGFGDGQIYFRTNGVTRTEMILVRPGDLLVSGINGIKGAIAVYSRENHNPAAATIHYGAYEPRGDRVDARFLWWFLRSKPVRELLLRQLPGGIKTELKPKRLLAVSIPLPPIPEQHRVLNAIEGVAARMQRVKRLRSQTMDEMSSLRASMEKRFLGDADGSPWDLVPLHSVCSVFVDCDHRTPDYVIEGVSLIRPRDIKPGSLDLLHTVKIDESEHLRRCGRHRPVTPDIVYSRELSYGNAAMVPPDTEICLGQGTVVMRADASKMSDTFLLRVLNASAVNEQAKRFAKGAVHPHVNIQDIRRFLIPLPSLDAQARIVAELERAQVQLERVVSLQRATGVQFDALLSSTLHALLGRHLPHN